MVRRSTVAAGHALRELGERCALLGQIAAWPQVAQFIARVSQTAPSQHDTIEAILRRHDRQVVRARTEAVDVAPLRFRASRPGSALADQGTFRTRSTRAGRCHPLAIFDDHSRFSLCLAACGNEQRSTTQEAKTMTFKHYGLPERITADNGSPWGSAERPGLTRWLVARTPKVRAPQHYAYMASLAQDKVTLLALLEELGPKLVASLWAPNRERSLESCQRWARQM